MTGKYTYPMAGVVLEDFWVKGPNGILRPRLDVNWPWVGGRPDHDEEEPLPPPEPKPVRMTQKTTIPRLTGEEIDRLFAETRGRGRGRVRTSR